MSYEPGDAGGPLTGGALLVGAGGAVVGVLARTLRACRWLPLPIVRKTPAAASTTTTPANRSLRWRSVRSIVCSLFAVVAFHRAQAERHRRRVVSGLAVPQRGGLPASAVGTGVASVPALAADGRGVPFGRATARRVL